MKNSNHILEELKEIAPVLSSLQKTNFYQVPENYFTHFQSGMLQKIQALEVNRELKTVAPQLAELQKDFSKEVPANYFESFPTQVLNKISAQKANTSSTQKASGLSSLLDKLSGFLFKPKYAFAFAGTVSILVIGLMMFLKVEECKDLDCQMAALTDEEINSYLDENAFAYAEDMYMEGDEMSAGENGQIDQAYLDLMKDIGNEELDRAILN